MSNVPSAEVAPGDNVANAQTLLGAVEIEGLPITNPIRRLNDRYARLRGQTNEPHLPHLQDFLEVLDDDLMDYCLVLLPVCSVPFIDFQVLHRGKKIPGSDVASFKYGEQYTDHILPKFAAERLLELASCLALKSRRFSETLSARRSSLKVRVYRAVFPVWLADHQTHGVILAIASATC